MGNWSRTRKLLERGEILAFKSLQVLASISGWPRGAVVANRQGQDRIFGQLQEDLMNSGMGLAKIKEQLIITWNGIFRNSAAIANVQDKRNRQLSLLLEDPVRPCSY
jgi:hypothetical protein